MGLLHSSVPVSYTHLDVYKRQVYVSAGCTESTQDLVFSGHSMIAENGGILAENQKLLDTDYVLTMDLSLIHIS